MKHYLVISAVGNDRPGIVNDLSEVVFEHECNIDDSRMTVLGGEFALMLLVSGNWNTIAKLEASLPKLQSKLDLTLIFKRTEARATRKNSLPYSVEVIAIDHPGIVYQVANFFSSRQINIEDLLTSSYPAAHTGSPVFNLSMRIALPSDIHIATLREQFLEFCDELNLDSVIEPLKI